MTRRRRGAPENDDALDLLLDTVSNVFGGVMFLTLLAALMILSRGAPAVQPESVPEAPTQVHPPTDDRIVQMEIRQTVQAIATEQTVLANLPGDSEDVPKLKEIKAIRSLLDDATRATARSQKEFDAASERADRQQSDHAEKRNRRDQLAGKLATRRDELERAEKVGQRSIAFRPLELADSTETILVLRYGRVYLFQDSPNSRTFNVNDFFAIDIERSKTRITPKPHRGTPVTATAMKAFADRIRRSYPPSRYHVTIAVWDDSFGQFNTVCDALQSVGYRYRTIPCNDESELSFGSSASPLVQ
ncbi:hypothetical protein [Neorhodopirellula pilleata]|uniref:Uncharacterized protein n=1 Tax=Neorhodopirellula pilleata TaxID=2714738 RepID=A0A5C5ZXV8_9BACT|nr:hypothetical protein [Neorhodopirellula pilleata]TWT91841.1 hypothetical protein Pla100_48790 [Neorhodopirellula pilleata]